MGKWISFIDARDGIVERRLQCFADDYLESVKFASQVLMDALIAGTLPSRPKPPSEFAMTFRSHKMQQSFALQEDGTITPQFWIHWQEAMDIASRDVVCASGPTTASSYGGDFIFKQAEGLIDDGILEGRALGVELLRERIQGLPRPRGRPSDPTTGDKEALQLAMAALDSGEWWFDVLPRVSALMDANSPNAARSRLSRKLSAAGYRAPRSRKKPNITT